MCLPVPPAPQKEVPGNATSATLGPLSSSTTYTVQVTSLYSGGVSSTLTGHVITGEWEVGGAGPGWAAPSVQPRSLGPLVCGSSALSQD